MRLYKSPVMAGALAYLAAVYFLVILGSSDARTKLNAALSVPDVAIYCALVAALITAWTFVIGPGYRLALKYSDQIRQHRYELLGDILALLVLCAVLLVSRNRALSQTVRLPVVYQREKIVLVTLFGAVTVLPCLLGFRLVSFQAEKVAMEQGSDTVAVLTRLEELRADLRWFLRVAGAVVGGGTLATGALRNAIAALNGGMAPPPSGIILYGGFCSGVIALFYIPAHAGFAAAARAAVSRLIAAPGDVQEWLTAIERREKLETSLGVNVTAMSLLGEVGAIIAPLVGSAVSFLLRLP